MPNRKLANLHLLATFKAILEEGSVVRAARALGVSQSAVSKHLASLREWLGDALFLRTGSGMQPTPRALAIAEQVAAILAETEKLTRPAHVEPSAFEGNFVISSTDEVLARLLPGLIERMSEQATKLRLTTVPLVPEASVRELETGAVNLVISVNWHAAEQLKQMRLSGDRFVCVMRRDHPLAAGALTAESYAATRHLLVAPLGMQQGIIDAVLAQSGLKRKVIASVPIFGLISASLLSSEHVVTIPHRVAMAMQDQESLVVKPLPFEAPMIDYYCLWHPRFDREPKLVWFRRQIASILRN